MTDSAQPGGHLRLRPVLLDVLRAYRRSWPLLVPMAAVVLVPQALAQSALDLIEAPRLEAWTDIAKLALLPGEVIVSLVGEAFYAGLVAASALLEPFQGLATVLVALALIELRGDGVARPDRKHDS